MNIDPTAFVNLASSLLDRFTPVAPGNSTLDPIQVLKDLRLPENLQKGFKAIFTAFGFEMSECTLESGFDEPRSANQFWMTSGQKLFLIHIPNWILERNSETDRIAVSYVFRFFPTEARVYLISEEVIDLQMAFLDNFESWRLNSNINVILIPWSKFKEMQTETSKPAGLSPAKRQAFLRLVFKLDQLPKDGFESAKLDLTPEERQTLIDIFVTQAKNAPKSVGLEGYFINLIDSSNIPEKWQIERRASLVGSPEDDARALIDWAVQIGKNTKDGRHSYMVLAELLERLIEAVGLDDQKFIKRLILKKPLLLEQKAKDAFCEKYPVKIE